jgi:hypothetical protein
VQGDAGDGPEKKKMEGQGGGEAQRVTNPPKSMVLRQNVEFRNVVFRL